MLRAPSAVLMLVIGAAISWAADEPKAKADPPGSASEQYQKLTKEYDTTLRKLSEEFQKATTNEARQKIREQARVLQKYPEQVLDLADKNPKEDFAVDAIVWAIQRTRNPALTQKAVAAIEKHHQGNPKIAGVLEVLAESGSPAAEKLFRTIATKGPNKEVQGLATYGLAKLLQSKAEEASGDEVGKLNAEAEKLLEEVIAKYAAVAGAEGPLGESAKSELRALKHLAIGKVAPEIEGEDADSKKFKLSDYRGKVILLDFWGNW